MVSSDPAAARAAYVLIERFHVDRDQARLPVIAMNDVGPDAQRADGFEHGPVEEDESLAVVVVILAGAAIQARLDRNSGVDRSGKP